MRHGAHSMVWLNFFAKATTSPPTFNRKPAVWHASHPFLSVRPIKSSSIHLRATLWNVNLKCFRNGTQCLKFGLGPRTFYLSLRPRLHIWQRNRQSRSQQRFHHYRINQRYEQVSHFFYFSKLSYRFLNHGDKMISWWRLWPSTSKSTCVVLVWPRRMLLLGSVQADDRINWPRDVHLFKMKCKIMSRLRVLV